MQRCVLHIAEKPSVAKQLVTAFKQINNNGPSSTLTSRSQFNLVTVINHFPFKRPNEASPLPSTMIITSVSGHVMTLALESRFDNWHDVDPKEILTARITKVIKDESKSVADNIQQLALRASDVVLWLDCDREGENIAAEVRDICRGVNKTIIVHRAHFSATTIQQISRALASLNQINEKAVNAVDVRQILDFRLGITLTRLLTIRLRNRLQLPTKCISYGPCQFPCLALIVDRYFKNSTFKSELFFHMKVTVGIPVVNSPEGGGDTDLEIQLSHIGERSQCYDKGYSIIRYQRLLHIGYCKVNRYDSQGTTFNKPFPMNTVTLTILASKTLKLPSAQCMSIAEGLYNRGYISYPRTETNVFDRSLDLLELIGKQRNHREWGPYACKLLGGTYEPPRGGSRDDKAHPPIHPVSGSTNLEGVEFDVFQLITKHFLACCSPDAQGKTTVLEVKLSQEIFSVRHTVVTFDGYLEIYRQYESKALNTATKLPDVEVSVGQQLVITELRLDEGATTSPGLMTEPELITLLDKHCIGTDATMHEHINTIQQRQYVEKTNKGEFLPTVLGLALCVSFQQHCEDLISVVARRDMESLVSSIAEGVAAPAIVMRTYEDIFIRWFNKINTAMPLLEATLRDNLNRNTVPPT